MPRTPAPPGADDPDQPPSQEETVALLDRIRAGDEAALTLLVTRMLPRLRRWAHGRLPRSARGMLDTYDVVQVVAAKAVRQLAKIDVQRRGALGFYLRQAVDNEIISRWRQAARTPIQTSAGDSLPDADASPLDRLIGAERLRRYEAALLRLDDEERNAIIGRFEFDYDYTQLATFLGRPSAEAARLMVYRAVKRLTEQLRHA